MQRCFVVGCGKCGTTTLADHLARHPQVAFSSNKEPHFFSRDDVRARGMAWYDALFEPGPSHTMLAEASTSYSWTDTGPRAAREISELWPDAKIVYIARNPFSRLTSVFRELHDDRPPGVPPLPFDLPTALRIRPQLIDNSRYWQLMQPYRDLFPAQQIHYVVLEELQRDHERVLAELTSFLGLSGFESTPDALQSNPGERKLRDRRLRRALARTGLSNRLPRRVQRALRRPWRDGEIRFDARSRQQVIDVIGDDARTYLSACGLPADYWGTEFA